MVKNKTPHCNDAAVIKNSMKGCSATSNEICSNAIHLHVQGRSYYSPYSHSYAKIPHRVIKHLIKGDSTNSIRLLSSADLACTRAAALILFHNITQPCRMAVPLHSVPSRLAVPFPRIVLGLGIGARPLALLFGSARHSRLRCLVTARRVRRSGGLVFVSIMFRARIRRRRRNIRDLVAVDVKDIVTLCIFDVIAFAVRWL